MSAHDPLTCEWWDEPGPLWRPQPCPIEGCRYEATDEDGCGLAKLISVEEAMRRWDEGDPVVHGCLAHRRGEDVGRHMACRPSGVSDAN